MGSFFTVDGNGYLSVMRKSMFRPVIGCCARIEACQGKAGWSGEQTGNVVGVHACEATSAGGADNSAEVPGPEYVGLRFLLSEQLTGPLMSGD